jgi:ribosomal 30S subunit maturation factor RimM
MHYITTLWHHYEILKTKTLRPFEDIEEFKKEFIKRDARVINKTYGTITAILETGCNGVIMVNNNNRTFEELFYGYTWLDGSPIGVEE